MSRLFIAGFLNLAHSLPDAHHFLGRRVLPLAPSRQVQNVSQPEFVLAGACGMDGGDSYGTDPLDPQSGALPIELRPRTRRGFQWFRWRHCGRCLAELEQ
jgi:hypothetical protein